MTDFFSELMSETPSVPQTAATAAPPVATGYDFFSDSLTATPTPKDTPGAAGGYDPAGEAPNIGFFDQMRAGLAVSTADKIKRYAEITGKPESQFGVIDQKIVMWNGKQYVPVEPNVSDGDGAMEKWKRAGEWTAAGTPAGVTAIGSGIAGLTQGNPVTGALAAAGTAGVLDAGRQFIDRALAGEDKSNIDWTHTGMQAALGGVAELGGHALAKMFTSNRLGVADWDRLKALDDSALKSAQEFQRRAKAEFGIDLSTGQATGLRSILARERQAGRWDETADGVAEFRDTQWGTQVPKAIQNEIRKVSPKKGADAVSTFREGADEVISQAEKRWMNEAGASFRNALDNKPPYNTPELDTLMKRPIMADAWREAKLQAANRGRPLPEYFKFDEAGNIIGTIQKPDWRAWHNIKMGLDRVKNNNLNALGKPAGKGAQADAVKAELMPHLRVNKDYMDALRQYGESADVVDSILQGGVGYLRDMKKMDVAGIVNRVFNENNLPVEEIIKMRQMFGAAGQAEKWNAGVSRWLADALDVALKDTAGGNRNVPNAFLGRVYGGPQRQEIFRAAVGKDAMKRWDALLETLQAAKKSLPEGSPTATDIGAMAPDMLGSAVQSASKAASIDIIPNLGKGFADIRQPAARVKLANFLFSPEGIKELGKLRMLPKGGEAAVRLLGDILVKSGANGAANAIGFGGERGADPRLNKEGNQ